jgi:hypothetical protein
MPLRNSAKASRPERMNKKKKKRIIILAIVGFVFILSIGSIEYTSHSHFCSSCHYMKPFYRSWETSSHSHVECNSCHYPPGLRSKLRAKVEGILQVGRYWTKLYLKSKPWAEIPDESCLREGCHDKRILEGKAKFNKIVFDHKIHFSDLKRGKQLRCTSCHSQIVQGEHITVTNSTCFICHFKESEHYPQISECSHCHHQEDLVSEKTSKYNHSFVFDNGLKCDKCHSQTIIGDGDVPRENCYKCHWETDRLNKYDDTDLMHSTHIFSHKIECNLCHLDIQHKIVKDIETIADCKTCHTDYHKAQKILFAGEGGKGQAHPMPNIMLEKGLSCKGCHVFHEETDGRIIKSETFVSRARACESCHGRGFSRILKDWEISTEKKLNEIKSIYTRIRQEIVQTKKPKKEKAISLLEEAAFNIDIVERGKSVHNMTYSQELLRASYDNLIEALRLISSSYKPKIFLASAKEVPTLCSNCHAGIEEINTQIFGLDFPHKRHLIEQKIQCSTCHSNAKRHGEFIATKKSCAVCHHREPEKDCTICHQIQKMFYQGGQLNGQKIPEDIMFESDVECTGCHLNPQNQIYRSDGNKCVDCHEEEYGKIFSEWQNSVKDLVRSLKNSLAERKKLSLSKEEKTQISNIEEALKNIEFDGSSGIHNYSAIEETLTNFQKTLESFGENPLIK